jgi:hypothetical protein
MISSLMPATAYECVVAENLIAIEWELLQHRRMHNTSLRGIIGNLVLKAVVAKHLADHELALDQSWEHHMSSGGKESAWKAAEFDKFAAEHAGRELGQRAVSPDRETQRAAQDELALLGMDPVEIMGTAYRTVDGSVTRHEEKLRELERRRREVKRDFDTLQRVRPIEGEVIEG